MVWFSCPYLVDKGRIFPKYVCSVSDSERVLEFSMVRNICIKHNHSYCEYKQQQETTCLAFGKRDDKRPP